MYGFGVSESSGLTVMVGAFWPLTCHVIELRHASHDANRNICTQSVVGIGSKEDEMILCLQMRTLLAGIQTPRRLRRRGSANWPRQRRNFVFLCGGA
jgi:hypothetical protein